MPQLTQLEPARLPLRIEWPFPMSTDGSRCIEKGAIHSTSILEPLLDLPPQIGVCHVADSENVRWNRTLLEHLFFDLHQHNFRGGRKLPF